MEPKLFTLKEKPDNLASHRKKTTVALSFQTEPFRVDTQEGVILISPDTVDDWDNGYYLAYPDDGSKPYSISPSFVRNNYVEVQDVQALVRKHLFPLYMSNPPACVCHLAMYSDRPDGGEWVLVHPDSEGNKDCPYYGKRFKYPTIELAVIE